MEAGTERWTATPLPPTAHPPAAALRKLDEAGWARVADRLLHGLCHDLNGLGSSVAWASYLLEGGDGGADTVPSLLGREAQRLARAVEMLRLLPDDALGERVLLAPAEVVPSLLELAGFQRGLEGIRSVFEGSPTAPAIRMDPTVFQRTLLLLLTRACERAALQGTRSLRVSYGADRSEGVLVIETAGEPGQELPPSTGSRDLGFRLSPAMEPLVAEVLEEQGARLHRHEGPEGYLRFEIRFPAA